MAKRKKGRHCFNREVVNVGHRLFSPRYDFEGEDGRAWYEWGITTVGGMLAGAGAMCGYGFCGESDAQSWKEAADHFIQEKLKPMLQKVEERMAIYTGGGPMPPENVALMNTIKQHIKNWEEFRDQTSPPYYFFQGELAAYILQIVFYFDEAACYVDDLNDIALEIKSPDILTLPPVVEARPPPDGGRWLRGGKPGKEEPGEKAGGLPLLGWLAIGAAGYFGYRMLTE